MARHGRVRGALRGLPWLLGIGILVAALAAAWPVVAGSGMDVTVSVDGYDEAVRTSRSSVAQLLTDLGVRVRPEDRVTPALDTPVAPGMAVTVRRARLGAVEADGSTFTAYTHASDVGGLLADVGLNVAPHDELWMSGVKVARDAAAVGCGNLREAASGQSAVRGRGWVGHEPQPVRLSVRRAVPLVIDDGSVPFTVFTTAPTVGEALLREQVTVFLGDGVQPALGSRVQAGMRVLIQRSKPVLVTADRRTVQTRTRGKTVGDALVELGVVVSGNDRVTPALATNVRDNTLIKVVRVLETMEVERDPISFASISVPDAEMEIDNQRHGAAGRHRRAPPPVQGDGGGWAGDLPADAGRLGGGRADHTCGGLWHQDRPALDGHPGRADHLLAQDARLCDLVFAGPLRHTQVGAVVRHHAHRSPRPEGPGRRRSDGAPPGHAPLCSGLWHGDGGGYRERPLREVA